jgi:hypothetical protein
MKQKTPGLARGFAACQDVSDFTRSAALIFIDGLTQQSDLVKNSDIKLKHKNIQCKWQRYKQCYFGSGLQVSYLRKTDE